MSPLPVSRRTVPGRAGERDRALELNRKLTIASLCGATILGSAVTVLAAQASAGAPDTPGAAASSGGTAPGGGGSTDQLLPGDQGSGQSDGSSATSPDQSQSPFSSGGDGFSAPGSLPQSGGGRFGRGAQAVSGGSGR